MKNISISNKVENFLKRVEGFISSDDFLRQSPPTPKKREHIYSTESNKTQTYLILAHPRIENVKL